MVVFTEKSHRVGEPILRMLEKALIISRLLRIEWLAQEAAKTGGLRNQVSFGNNYLVHHYFL